MRLNCGSFSTAVRRRQRLGRKTPSLPGGALARGPLSRLTQPPRYGLRPDDDGAERGHGAVHRHRGHAQRPRGRQRGEPLGLPPDARVLRPGEPRDHHPAVPVINLELQRRVCSALYEPRPAHDVQVDLAVGRQRDFGER